MKKPKQIAEFLEYGGNELFSSLMTDESERSIALDRLTILLGKFVIRGRFIKGKVHGYRYMISEANSLGFIKSTDLNRFTLTDDECKRVIEKAMEYAKENTILKSIIKKTAVGFVALCIVSGLIFAVYKYMQSDLYMQRMYSIMAHDVTITVVNSGANEIIFEIRNNSNSDYFIKEFPELKYYDFFEQYEEKITKKTNKNSELSKSLPQQTIFQDDGSYLLAKEDKIVFTLKGSQYESSFDSGEYTCYFKFSAVNNDGNTFEVVKEIDFEI